MPPTDDCEPGYLTRRTSEVDFKQRHYHAIEPIIITPATPLPSPHKHQHAAEGLEEEGAVGESQQVAAVATKEAEEEEPEQEDGEEDRLLMKRKGASSNVLLIDLRPSTPTGVHKSMDNLSRCESPIEPPQIERKCSVYRPRPGPEQKYYYYDDESKLNENDTYYDSYGRTIRYELDPNGVYRAEVSGGEPYSYDPMVPAGEHGNSWISPEYFCESAKMGRKHSTGICTCDQIEVMDGLCVMVYSICRMVLS